MSDNHSPIERSTVTFFDSPAVISDDPRLRRIYYRCNHRGIKEMDLMLGGFVRERLAYLTKEQVDELEAIMEVPDQDLLSWMTGAKPIPAEWDTELFRQIIRLQCDRAGE